MNTASTKAYRRGAFLYAGLAMLCAAVAIYVEAPFTAAWCGFWCGVFVQRGIA